MAHYRTKSTTKESTVIVKAEVKESLRTSIKVRAAQEGRTVTSVIRKALEAYLATPLV